MKLAISYTYIHPEDAEGGRHRSGAARAVRAGSMVEMETKVPVQEISGGVLQVGISRLLIVSDSGDAMRLVRSV